MRNGKVSRSVQKLPHKRVQDYSADLFWAFCSGSKTERFAQVQLFKD